eukprot:SAG31_NODE_23875_length_493_cov_1.545685_1_plen_27_part_10
MCERIPHFPPLFVPGIMASQTDTRIIY